MERGGGGIPTVYTNVLIISRDFFVDLPFEIEIKKKIHLLPRRIILRSSAMKEVKIRHVNHVPPARYSSV